MKDAGKIVVCLAGGLMLSIGTRVSGGLSAGNPYETIVTRNVFGLNPPPPPGSTSGDEAAQLPKITLNGIMSIFNHQLQALFKVAPKPGQKDAKEESYVLSEGQAQDDIEVVHIDEKAALVTFNNHGTVQEIPLANAPKITTPAIAGGGGNNSGIPPRMGGRFSGPGAHFGGPNRAMGGGENRPPFNNASAQNQGGNNLSSEDQMVLVAAEHLKAQQEGRPEAIIFPPTRFDEEAGITPSTPSVPTPSVPNPSRH
jgi:hypothetical protein